MSSSVDELNLDIEELDRFLKTATRQRTKDLLSIELRKLQTKVANLLGEQNNAPKEVTHSVPKTTNTCYEVTLANYGWDQSDTMVNLYITLKDVQKLPKESFKLSFTERSLDVRILGLENKNYKLTINNLYDGIKPEASSFKVKTNMIVVFMAKAVPKNQWSHVTSTEKKLNDAKMSDTLDSMKDEDPDKMLMKVMSKIYQQGDPAVREALMKACRDVQ